jgi:EAL domain-containing protein (putative c-di-GMP-specific phosphodiesterase class I)
VSPGFSHLVDVRPSEIEIDKRFIDGLPDDPTSAGLVRGVLGLARGMGLITVAKASRPPHRLTSCAGADAT